MKKGAHPLQPLAAPSTPKASIPSLPNSPHFNITKPVAVTERNCIPSRTSKLQAVLRHAFLIRRLSQVSCLM